jgi:hypothetical protein
VTIVAKRLRTSAFLNHCLWTRGQASRIRPALLVLLLFGPNGISSPASAAPITVAPPLSTASVGDGVLLDLTIADVTSLFAYQLDITFDPAILRADAVSDRGFLTSGGGISVFGGVFPLAIDNTAGVITILDSLLGPAPPETGVTGGGILATLSFRALAPGTTDVLLLNLILENAEGLPINAVLTGGQVTVVPNPLPEPGAIVLLVAGVAGAIGRQRHSAFRRVATARGADHQIPIV